MSSANQQLVDLMKGLSVRVVAVLPFAPITIPVLIALGRRFGLRFYPVLFTSMVGADKDSQENLIENQHNAPM